jgi:phosphate transport system substrate-binding protein
MMRLKLAFLLSAFIFLASCAGRQEAAVVAAGSTSVLPYAEILVQEYAKQYPGKIVEVQGGGSSAGIMAIRSDIAHIGMSSRNLRGDELDLWHTEIAKDGLAIIIHPDNPIENLTREQLRDIYAAVITNWSEVGGSDARIHLVTREEGSGTRSAFEELVMGDARITPRAIVQNFNGAIRQIIADDPHAIGFISLGLVDVGEKPVKAAGIDGVAPTRENVINSDYVLYRSFWFVTMEEPEGYVRAFIDFVFSPEGRRILTNEGLVAE